MKDSAERKFLSDPSFLPDNVFPFLSSLKRPKNSWKVSKYNIHDKFSYCPSNMKAKSRQWPAASCNVPYLTVLILLFESVKCLYRAISCVGH